METECNVPWVRTFVCIVDGKVSFSSDMSHVRFRWSGLRSMSVPIVRALHLVDSRVSSRDNEV